jgi:non-haem dioxygenase in morphine synthesis N-terminal
VLHVVDWADLATLDLSRFDQPGGKEQLAKQLFEAIQNIGQEHTSSQFSMPVILTSLGFFYIVNFGLSQEDVDRQFSIGKELFKLPIEEKLKYRAELEKGGYNGYKPMGLRVSRNRPYVVTSLTLTGN